MALVEAAAEFAFDVLEDGGTFVAKVLAGGAEIEMQTMLKQNFTKVANVKPPGQPGRQFGKVRGGDGVSGPLGSGTGDSQADRRPAGMKAGASAAPVLS